jgi:hypothetical protein
MNLKTLAAPSISPFVNYQWLVTKTEREAEKESSGDRCQVVNE